MKYHIEATTSGSSILFIHQNISVSNRCLYSLFQTHLDAKIFILVHKSILNIIMQQIKDFFLMQ